MVTSVAPTSATTTAAIREGATGSGAHVALITIGASPLLAAAPFCTAKASAGRAGPPSLSRHASRPSTPLSATLRLPPFRATPLLPAFPSAETASGISASTCGRGRAPPFRSAASPRSPCYSRISRGSLGRSATPGRARGSRGPRSGLGRGPAYAVPRGGA